MLNKKKAQLVRYPKQISGPVVATLGNFDGIHLGHQALLKSVIEVQKKLKINSIDAKTALVSFYPHPAIVLGKATKIPALTNISKKIEILSEIGIDYLYLIHFTKKFSEYSAEYFIENILRKMIQVSHLVIGPDARVGRDAEGTADNIKKLGDKYSIETTILPFEEVDGQRMSSRGIRVLIEAGDCAQARLLLGRAFSIKGRVVRGNNRGKSLGFPTANTKVAASQLIPADGVYATYVKLNDREYRAVTNIGVRPTFANTGRTIETYLIDYNGGDFYSDKIELLFIQRIRDEKPFNDISQLIEQIQADVELADEFLKTEVR